MVSTSEPTLTSHSEASFDPDLYVSLFFGANLQDEPESKWAFDQIHDIFKDGLCKVI